MNRIYAVTLVAGGILIGACAPNPFAAKEADANNVTKWEMKTISKNLSNYAEAIEAAGDQGWEFVTVDSGTLYFKRPKP
jgi:hypothetical protein